MPSVVAALMDIRLWWSLKSWWWPRRWSRTKPVDPWCWHCRVLNRDPLRNLSPRGLRWPNIVTKLQHFLPSTCSNLSSRLSSSSLGLCEGCHEFPQSREAFVALLDLLMVAFLDVDDVVAVILQDLRREQQILLNSCNVSVEFGHVIPGLCGVAPELLQLLLPSEDRRSQSHDAGEMIHCSGPLTTQLGVLLDEVIDRCLQSHGFLTLTFIIHLLVVASPCMSQMDHLTLPFIKSCIEHVLGSFRLPCWTHVKVVEFSMNRPERNGDGRIGVRRVDSSLHSTMCSLPGRIGSHLVSHLHKVEA